MNQENYGVLTELDDKTLVFITMSKGGKFKVEHYEESDAGLEPLDTEFEERCTLRDSKKYSGIYE